MEEFEIEVRVALPNVEPVRRKLRQLKAKGLKKIWFVDHFYKPSKSRNEEWDSLIKTMRIRELPDSASLLFDKVHYLPSTVDRPSVKQSAYSGKILLYRGNIKFIKELLRDLGFRSWFAVEHLHVKTYKVAFPVRFTCTVEEIKHIGNMIEIEALGSDVDSANSNLIKALQALGIDKRKTISKSLPQLVAMKLGKI